MDWSRRVVDASAGGLWVVDLQGQTLDANAATAGLLGVTPARLSQMNMSDFLDATGRGQLAEHLGELQAGRVNAYEVECLFYRPDGAMVWAELREALLLDDDGETVVAAVLNVDDISDRKRLVDDIQLSERKRVQAEQVARLGSWEWDLLDGSISYSDGIERLYGERASTVFTSYDSFLEAVHPDDRARVTASMQRVLDGEPSFEFEARVHAERGYIWIYSRGVGHRDADGVLDVVLGTHLDVTQVRDTDDALRDLVKQNALMQTVASAANEATTLTEVLTHARSMVLLHDDWDRARAFIPTSDGLDLLEVEGEPEGTEGHDVIRGRERQTALRCLQEHRAVWDEDTNLTLAFPVVLDDEVIAVVTITSLPPLYRHEMIESMTAEVAIQLARVAERERNARELAEARDRALNASQQKSTFLSTMSHEIRTPLHGVIGLTELLGRTSLDEQQRHLISGIDLSSRALLAVISDVLDFSKIEAGRLELETVDYEVRAVLDQVAAVLAESARGQDLELTVSCSPDVPQVASGDPHRLAQVLTNLGSNAVKFTPSGVVVVRATTVTGHDGRRMLRIQVRDTGIGVPADRQGSIFEPFAQADASTTRQYGGTGLGLAISQEIVATMGGEMGLESVEGLGSSFWFTVPLPAPRGVLLGETLARTRVLLQGLQVLVVDDVVTNLHILTEQLAWWGVDSVTAADAAEAMRTLHEHPGVFDVVVLDMAMPQVDGLMLADQIRADPRYADVPMMMLSSSLPLDDAVLSAHGIGHCLSKPVSSSLLCDVLLSIRNSPSGLSASPRSVVTRTSQRLLIVEDNPVNRIVASGFLDALGYAAETAENGVEALEMIERTGYDLILMDVQMPGIDGYATTRMLRAREARLGLRRTPVVAMTAAAFKGERERALDSGMDDFMTKPVTGARVASMVSRWVVGDVAAGPEAATVEVLSSGELLDHERFAELEELTPDGSYLDRAMTSFIERAPGMLADVHDAATAADLSATAHALKGSASNLGAARVSEAAGMLEALGRREQPADPALLVTLDAAMADTITALRDHQSRTSEAGHA